MGSVSEDDNLADIQQLGDEEHGVAHFREIDHPRFVVDVRERQRTATVRHAEIAQGVCGRIAVLAHHVGTSHRDERLHVDHHKPSLGSHRDRCLGFARVKHLSP